MPVWKNYTSISATDSTEFKVDADGHSVSYNISSDCSQLNDDQQNDSNVIATTADVAQSITENFVGTNRSASHQATDNVNLVSENVSPACSTSDDDLQSSIHSDENYLSATAIDSIAQKINEISFTATTSPKVTERSGSRFDDVTETENPTDSLDMSSSIVQTIRGSENTAIGSINAHTFGENVTINYFHTKKGSYVNDEKDCGNLKSKLKKHYKDIVIPCVNWLDEGEDFIFKDFYVELQQTVKAKDGPDAPIRLQEIFRDIDGTTPKRILIESQPGYGKTTLASKMAYDWATDEPYMQKFDLVFLIYLRNLNKGTLENELQSIIRFCDPHSKIKIEGINRDNVLLILDGCDELSTEAREDITKTLYGVNFWKTTVVATSRFGLFPLDKNDLRKIIPEALPCIKSEFCQKKITILGIDEKHRRQFLEKFCPNHSPKKILSAFSRWPNNITQMLHSPLLLFLVSYFNATELKLDQSSTLTDVYKSLMNNIVKTNLMKSESAIGEDFNLFVVSRQTYWKFQSALTSFGFKCLDQLVKGYYTFPVDELMNEVYTLGLLTKYKKRLLYSNEYYYDCFHLSIMEFCIAYYFWMNFNLFQRLDPMLLSFANLSDVLEKNAGTSLIYIFLKDLMQDKSHLIIDKLRECKCKLFEELTFWQLVSRVKVVERTAEIVADFVNSPVHKEVDVNLRTLYESELHADIIKHAVQKNSNLEVCMNDQIHFALPSDITIPKITIGRDGVSEIDPQIHCDILSLITTSKINDHSLQVFLSTTPKNAKQITVTNWSSDGLSFIDHINFWKIQVCLNVLEKEIFDVISKILNENRVYSLNVMYYGNNQNGIDKLISRISINNSLCQLELKIHNPSGNQINLHPISQRQWENLEISNLRFTCSGSSSVEKCDDCCKIAQFIEKNGSYSNSDTKGLDSQCPWRNDKPKYHLNLGEIET